MTVSYRNKTVRILDLLEPDEHPSFLEDLEFFNCTIVGPAVLLLTERVTLRANHVATEQLWPLDRRAYIGGIGVRDCTFDECTFLDVGLGAPHDVIQQFFDTATTPAPPD